MPPDRIGTTLGLRFLGGRLKVGTRLNLVEARTGPPGGLEEPRDEGLYGLADRFTSYALDALASPGLVAKAALGIKFATR